MVFTAKCPYCKRTTKYRMLNDDARKIVDDAELSIKCKCGKCCNVFIPDGQFVSKLRNAAEKVVKRHDR